MGFPQPLSANPLTVHTLRDESTFLTARIFFSAARPAQTLCVSAGTTHFAAGGVSLSAPHCASLQNERKGPDTRRGGGSQKRASPDSRCPFLFVPRSPLRR